MAEVKKLTDREILESLGADRCMGCGARKMRKRSHCSKCYYALPPEMRTALYNLVGDGYEEAFVASLNHLGIPAERAA